MHPLGASSGSRGALEGDWDAAFGDADLPQPHASLWVALRGVSLGSGGALAFPWGWCLYSISHATCDLAALSQWERGLIFFPLIKGETETQKGCRSRPIPEEG